ncbi:P22 phage major capsid protein family protein [Streptomyces sp. DSM 44915]|uniref:P22 phage major capsid protein family protein n=1 Tax=Streptomyces chisholmiae TaxID=3075540 RepID=A0ABU2K1E3_9ACTN|nr:P22 phage major capsid protein family protein [Streptomyces sp. DSM 44915]MDT0270263.1 P22 phage major capsid protein family protein [Streptomyces sp. DSM 44915]
MTIRNFVPEIWSSRLLVALRKELVYAGPQVVNRDWEGDISEAGDTVRITSVGRPTVGNYVPGSTVITPQKLVTGQRTLVVDQAKYWAFSVDDVDARQARSNLMPQAMSEAAHEVADIVDQYVASLYTQIAATNLLNDPGAPIDTHTTPTDAYSQVLVPLRTRLRKANVPTAGRYCIVPPEFMASLLDDDRFVKVGDSGTSEGLRNGLVGRAAGFDIYESNNVPEPTAGVAVITAGTNAAITFAEQINKTEAYRPESSFSDAVKGLALYGAKVVRPNALAAAFVEAA